MRIKEITIKNYKNIGIDNECNIKIPQVDGEGSSDFLTIIGENNIGKSSIMEAIRLFLPETDIVSNPSIDMFPYKIEPQDEKEYMEIYFVFNDLTLADQKHAYIKPCIYNEELHIKRIWSKQDLKDNQVPFEVFINERSIPILDGFKTWNAKAFENENVNSELKDLFNLYCKEKEVDTISNKEKGSFIDYVLLHNEDLITYGEPKWVSNPNGLASKLRTFMPKVIYVPAVKMTSEEADANKTKSAASQIASLLFEQHLNGSPEITQFKDALDSLKSIFDTDTKHGEVKKLQDKLSKKLKRIMEVEAHVDFEVPEVMEKLHLNSTIQIKHNNLVTTPSEQGNGIQRMLILSLLELMAEQYSDTVLDEEINPEIWKRSILFLIEEPEIYLHPHLQRKMRDSLVSISEHPSAQVICTSHSEKFIDLADRHQGVILLQRKTNGTANSIQVSDNIYSGDTKKEKRSRMRMLLNFNASTLEAFFASRVILVEGDCEVASFIAIKDYLKEKYPDKADDIERETKSISIIPCNGKLTQKAYYQVLKRFGIQPYLIHDLDGEGLEEGNNNIILATIGTESHRLTHNPNFEKHIFNQEWNADKPWKATELINNQFETYSDGLIRFFKFIIGESVFNTLRIFEEETVARE
ncbi:MAG: AAA family ATPase [Bacillaceae bacterium]